MSSHRRHDALDPLTANQKRKQHKRRKLAIAQIKTQVSFYNTIIAPFEPQADLLYPLGLSTPRPKTSKCYLLELPAELRIQIYEYVLTSSSDWHICLRRRNLETFAQTPLLRTSRQIRKEALPVYYYTNDFTIRVCLDLFDVLTRWLKRITKQCGVQPFKTVRFEIQGGRWMDACKVFPLMNLVRRGKLLLVAGEGKELFNYVESQEGRSRIPSALNSLVRLAGEDSLSVVELVEGMGGTFEREIRKRSAGKREVRVESVRTQCALLKAAVEVKKKKSKK